MVHIPFLSLFFPLCSFWYETEDELGHPAHDVNRPPYLFCNRSHRYLWDPCGTVAANSRCGGCVSRANHLVCRVLRVILLKKTVETVLTSEVSHVFKIPCSLMIVRQAGTHTERALTDLYDKMQQVIYIFFIFILCRHAEDIGNDQSFKISRYTQIMIGYISIRLIKIVPRIPRVPLCRSACKRKRPHPLYECFHARRKAAVHLAWINLELETCIKCSSGANGGVDEVPNRKHRSFWDNHRKSILQKKKKGELLHALIAPTGVEMPASCFTGPLFSSRHDTFLFFVFVWFTFVLN